MQIIIDEDKIIDVLETEWGYEGIREDVSTVLRENGTPIVRCKDCVHAEHWYRDKALCYLWHEEGIDVFEDGYCNYGKKKMNDLISRQAAIEAVYQARRKPADEEWERIVNALRSLPSIEADKEGEQE